MSLSDTTSIPELPTAQRIVIPYTPRKHFLCLHTSRKRFKFICAHRRAGKSVSAINEIIKRALQNTRVFPIPRYGYVGPSFAQTKDLIWGYLKQFAGVLPGVKFSESDLQCTLPNGATITLYGGAAAFERMRGLYFDGIMLDEFPLLNPSVFSTVVRPCLADYRGWCIVSGTSNGDDHFHELKKRAEKDPDNWEIMIIPVTETDALHPDEVQEMTKDMTPEEYAREMLCAFDAPIEGAYYAAKMNDLMARGRITGVPYDSAVHVITWWDLGIHDKMSIGFIQRVGRELHAIDYYENDGFGLDHYAKVLKEKPYVYGAHVLPHDIEARELGTGRSRQEVLGEMLNDLFTCPMHSVEDGIQATRSILDIMWFDKVKTEPWVSALRNYHRNEKGKPVHNWASHAADMTRTGAVSLNQVMSFTGSNIHILGNSIRRNIRGRV